MAVPAGSIAFTGYGDSSDMRFYSPAGVDLGALASNPNTGAGVDGIVALSTGKVALVGGNTPNFGTTGVGIFNSNFTVHAEGASSGGAFASRGIARDGAGNFYGGRSGNGGGGRSARIYKYTGDGAASFWNVGVTSGSMRSTGVTADGGIAYFGLFNTLTEFGFQPTKVYAHDLVNDVALGIFATAPTGYYHQFSSQGIIVLDSGDVLIGWKKTAAGASDNIQVIHYDSSGAVLYTYTFASVGGDGWTGGGITKGLTDSSFVAGIYDSTRPNYSQCRIVTVQMVTGTILADFTPDDGTFEFDSPMCVLTVAASVAPVVTIPVPNPTPGASQTPCRPQSQVGNGGIGASGCNTGGVGWVSDGYNGPFSEWVDHADPATGETLTGKTRFDVWFELTHTDPDGNEDDPYKRAMVELADPDDRKPAGLKAVGAIDYGLGGPTGTFQSSDVNIEYAGPDRLFHGLISSKELENDDIVVFAASPANRVSNPRVMARSLIIKPQLRSPLTASITAVDPLFAEFGPFGPDKKWPPTFADIGAGLPSITPDTQAQAIPSLWGQKTDKGATDPLTGHLQEKGVIPGYFCGMFDIGVVATEPTPGKTLEAVVAELQASVTAGTCVADWGSIIGNDDAAKLQSMGTVPTTYDSLAQVIGYGDLDALMADGETAPSSASTWGFIAFTLGEAFRYIQVFGSNLGNGDPKAEPDRVELNLDNRSDLLVPGHVWPFATNYREFTNPETGKVYWLSGIYVRGPLLTDHLHGVVNITANMWGRMGPDGLPINDVHLAQQHWIENDLLSDWTSGPYADAVTYPQWRDGTPKANSNTFKDRQAVTTVIGGRGLTPSWYVNTQKNLSEWFEEWNNSTETFLGQSAQGQIMIWGLNPFESTASWPAVRHVTDIFGEVSVTTGVNRENVVSGQCDWDADKQKFRSGVTTLPNQDAIRAYKNHRKLGNPVNSTILNDSTQFGYVLLMRGARLAYGMTMVEFTGPAGMMDYAIGSGIKLTSIEGSGQYGYINRLMIVFRQRFSFDKRLSTVTCWDVDTNGDGVPIIIPPSQQFTATDDESAAPIATYDESISPVAVS